MNGYYPNRGEDGNHWFCDVCGKQFCLDCITEQEYIIGWCQGYLEKFEKRKKRSK